MFKTYYSLFPWVRNSGMVRFTGTGLGCPLSLQSRCWLGLHSRKSWTGSGGCVFRLTRVAVDGSLTCGTQHRTCCFVLNQLCHIFIKQQKCSRKCISTVPKHEAMETGFRWPNDLRLELSLGAWQAWTVCSFHPVTLFLLRIAFLGHR